MSIANTTITPDMVASLYISRSCMESFPCRHCCKIVLSDGREKDVTLDARGLCPLIDAISREKISGLNVEGHFTEQLAGIRMLFGKVELQSAEKTLTRLFQ